MDVPQSLPQFGVFALAATTVGNAVFKEVSSWCTTVSVAAVLICVANMFIGGSGFTLPYSTVAFDSPFVCLRASREHKGVILWLVTVVELEFLTDGDNEVDGGNGGSATVMLVDFVS